MSERQKIEAALAWIRSLRISEMPPVPIEMIAGIEIGNWEKLLRSIATGLNSGESARNAAIVSAREIYAFLKKTEQKREERKNGVQDS